MSKQAAPMRSSHFSWLDFKVGFRMLARYPGLTLVGTVAIAVAIALGTLYFEAINKWQHPRLPTRDADRVVSIRNWDVKGGRPDGRVLHEFAIWRSEVRTVEQLGAAVNFMRNLTTDNGRPEPVPGAEITANTFRMLGATPLLGRALTDRDEQAGEPPVVVISHALWDSHFASDPGVLGRTVKLGTTTATIVGVMPEGFGFPMNQRLWTPLRVNGSVLEPRTGPSASVYGRLAPGASVNEAQAELDVIVDHLTAALGLRGAGRQAGSTAERARSAVTQRLRATIRRIGQLDGDLGRHLEASVRTGTFCVYRPERPTAWETRLPPT